MLLPDEIRKCVVFVGYKNADGIFQLAGTAFWVARHLEGKVGGFSYIVTAKHVIDNIRDRRADKVYLRLNLKSGNATWHESDIEDWIFHPDDSEVDVAIIRAGFTETFDHLTCPIDMFATDQIIAREAISAGNEVFLIGLFAQHHGQQRNIPIVRVGNIAAMPEERVETRYGLMDAYLIEVRSLGGISGSPVFVHLGTSVIKDGMIRPATRSLVYYLLGLMHGHWDIVLTESDALAEDAQGTARVNMGIAIVTPATKILEVINQPIIRKEEKEIEDEW